jgi:hypothetical protein
MVDAFVWNRITIKEDLRSTPANPAVSLTKQNYKEVHWKSLSLFCRIRTRCGFEVLNTLLTINDEREKNYKKFRFAKRHKRPLIKDGAER